MEETSRGSPATANAEAAPPETLGEGSRRRATGAKRKGLSGSSSSAASKRLAKERNLPSFHSYTHNGPVTRARQSPNKFTATAVVSLGVAEQPTAPGAADAAGGEENGGPGERMAGEDEDLDAMCEPVIDPDFDAIRTRGSNVHVVPTHAGWFSWERIHHLEKQSMDSFFNGKSEKRTADIYHKIRNSIMEKFHSDPQTDIEPKYLPELDIGDLDARQEVMEFLDHWGVINFHPFPPNASNSSASKTEVSAKAESLSERLYRFGVSNSLRRLAPKTFAPSASAMPTQLFSESTVFDDLVRPEGPSVEYHCNSCSVDCSRKRYHCQKQADFDLCIDCFNNEKFGSGMAPADFILMEPAEAPGTGGGSWSDQETLLLLEAMELYGENWNEIAEHVATKTKTQCILHFVQMPIEDQFLIDNSDSEDKNLPGKDESIPEISKDEEKKEKDGCKTEPFEEGALLNSLRTAFMAAGSGLKDGEFTSFAEAGNPVMALAAFLVALVDHDLALTSSRSSLRAMTEESPGIQLATRHCFVLEDPPKLQIDEQCRESQQAQVEVVEKVNDEQPSLSSGDCDQNQAPSKATVKDSDGSSLPIEKTADNANNFSNNLNNHCESSSETPMESSKAMPGSTDETKSKTSDSGHVGGEQPSEAMKSPGELPAEEKECLIGIGSDSEAMTKEPAGGDESKAAITNDENDSMSLKTDDETTVAKIKKAALSALSAAAVNAKLFIDQEEDCIRHLTSLVIEKQLRKLEIKLGLFGEIEVAISRAREHLDRARQRLLHERAQIITARLGLPPSSSRSMPPSLPAAKFSMAQSFPGPRPPMNLTPQRFPFK